MNIKAMRNVHLYLGVFFAPLLLFFIITGCLQTFNLHEKHKNDNYQPPQIIKTLSEVHKDQRIGEGRSSSKPFRYFVLLMGVGLLATTLLGIVMAFKYTASWVVWICLVAGIILPWILLM
jgi:hypothetical protein